MIVRDLIVIPELRLYSKDEGEPRKDFENKSDKVLSLWQPMEDNLMEGISKSTETG